MGIRANGLVEFHDPETIRFDADDNSREFLRLVTHVKQYRATSARIPLLFSARYIADLQDHWEIHGKEALDEYRHKFVDRYVENYALRARITRVEADVKHSPAKPKRWKKLSQNYWRARSAPKAAASLRSSYMRWPKMMMRT